MRKVLKKWMLWLTLAAAAAMVFIRLVAVPGGWLPEIAGWQPAMWATTLGGVVLLVDWVLCRLCQSPASPVDHRQLASVSTVSILCGAALLLCTLFDAGIWITTGQTPAPNDSVISGIDGLLLVLTLVFGVWGGAFLVRLGFGWLPKDISEHGRLRLMALTPVLWGWMRLARYVVSYASAVDVQKNLSEFLMLVFTILFFFSFARYVGAVGKPDKKTPMLLFYACGAFLFTLTSSIVRLAGYWNTAVSTATTQMAGAADMAVGLLALAVAVAVAYTTRTETVFERVRAKNPEWLPDGNQTEQPAAAEHEAGADAPETDAVSAVAATETPEIAAAEPADSAETAPEQAPTAAESMDVDDILNEIYRDKQ